MEKGLVVRVGCTIVSLNYLAYARTLCSSFLRHHPDCGFYVLIVDRLPPDFDISQEAFEVVLAEDLGVSDFESLSFKFDVLELNTNLKPTFLKRLLDHGVDEVIYFDPDIYIYAELGPIFEAARDHAIVVTPHSLSPSDDATQSEVLLLASGVFNLGFICVSRSVEAIRFLSWWENRCLTLGFDEQRSGLFVDQKWMNLAPCFFSGVAILRHPGCNMAYWNLHERRLTREGQTWKVNESDPLIFFHFSGILLDDNEKVSKYTERFTLKSRPDLQWLFDEYRGQLMDHGIRGELNRPYAFGHFDNGQLINRLTRSIYAAHLDSFRDESPFCSSSRFYAWAKKSGLLSATDSAKNYTSTSYSKGDGRIRAIGALMRVALRILGADRYTMLMKYISYVSILRNQGNIIRP